MVTRLIDTGNFIMLASRCGVHDGWLNVVLHQWQARLFIMVKDNKVEDELPSVLQTNRLWAS